MNGGRWKDRQIVPDDWMRAASEPHGRVLSDDYGYGLWVHRERAPLLFEAIGRGAQRIAVVPSKNMVLAITVGAFEPGEIAEFTFKAIRSDTALPPNSTATRRLEAAVRNAARPPLAQRATPLPDVAHQISGKRYLFEDNPMGWRAVTLRFSDARTAVARVEFSDGQVLRDRRPPIRKLVRKNTLAGWRLH